MEIFVIVIQILFAIGFITKTSLHMYIAQKNDNSIVGSGQASSVELLWFYTKPVSDGFKNLKQICNYIHWYNILSLLFILFYSGLRIKSFF